MPLTCPCGSVMRVGLMEEVGLLPGSMKLASDGGSPHSSVSSGVEKSDISLLKMMPVRVPRFFEPNLRKKKVNLRKKKVLKVTLVAR